VYGVPTVIKPNIEGLPRLIESLVANRGPTPTPAEGVPQAQPSHTSSPLLANGGGATT